MSLTAHLSRVRLSAWSTGHWITAIAAITRALNLTSLSPSSCEPLWLLRGMCHYRVDEYRSALVDLTRVLEVDCHSVHAQTLKVQCLFALCRYEEATLLVAQLTKQHEEERDARSCDASDRSDADDPYASLRLLVTRIDRELTGIYDVQSLEEECFSLMVGASEKDLAPLRRSRLVPCARLGPHADYVHPSLECGVPITGKGRGTRLASSWLIDSPSSGSSSVVSSVSCTRVAPYTLLMSCRAMVMWLKTDETVTRVDTLLRKLQDQPELVDQVMRLFGSDADEPYREALMQHESALDVWRRRGDPLPVPISSDQARVTSDRLALLRSRLASTLRCNPFGDSVPSCSPVGGSGLWFLPSLINHSCVPNCSWTLIGDRIFVRAMREIRAGEEVTISYYPLMSRGYLARQSKIKSGWHFRCRCHLCALVQRHPTLIAQEKQLVQVTECVSDEWTELRSEDTSLQERLTTIQELQSAVDHYEAFATSPSIKNTLSPHPTRIRLIRPLMQLARMMRDVLYPAVGTAGGEYKLSATLRRELLLRHWRACQTVSRICLAYGASGSASHAESVLEAVSVQQQQSSVEPETEQTCMCLTDWVGGGGGEEEAPVTVEEQEDLLTTWLRHEADSTGDTDLEPTHDEHRELILTRGLEDMCRRVMKRITGTRV